MVKYLFILFSLAFAVVTVGPGGNYDFTTIQAAIDSVTVNPVDIEIDVYPGTYQENLLIEADMIIRSVGDSSNTIIDGSNGRGLGSTIVTRPKSNSPIKPNVNINGFTIRNGTGTDIEREIDTPDGPQTITEKVGGGLFVYVNSPTINYCQFLSNGNSSTDEGGAVFAASGGDDIGFPDRDHYQDHPDLGPAEGPLDFSYNTFQGNRADYGHSVYIDGFENTITLMAGNILDVFSSTYNSASEYWVKSNSEVDYENVTGVEAIYNDVWVNPTNGIDEGNTLGDQNNPFLTIDYAMSMIYSTEDNPITINLTEGTFSPSTIVENFPIIMISNVNLVGQGDEVTILDAEQTNRVIIINNCKNNTLNNFTIRGGEFIPTNNNYLLAGGITIRNSDPNLLNLIITENSGSTGGGISMSYSNAFLFNLEIFNNEAGVGGGLFFENSNPWIIDTKINNNLVNGSSGLGGGGVFSSVSNPILSNVTICDNIVEGGNYGKGGGIVFEFSNPTLTNVTISGNEVLSPSASSGGMRSYWSNPIIKNSIIWNNSPDDLSGGPWDVNMSFSDIGNYDIWDGGYLVGENNISEDPFFTNTIYGDYTLNDDSPCIDKGDYNPWFNDMDNSRADMGATGGQRVLPNFTYYNFGEVGEIESTTYWKLSNFRETSIIIDSVFFNSNSFSTNTTFPLVIEPLESRIISINCLPENLEEYVNSMIIYSHELPEDAVIELTVTGVEGNVLTGVISGELVSNDYRISGDISVEEGETLIIQPGTNFLFDGPYLFSVQGVVNAIGTNQDSIIFDNLELDTQNRWKGFTLINQSEETIFDYVRISGAKKTDYTNQFGGGLYLRFSDPIISHTVISNNEAQSLGQGIYLHYSNPSFFDVLVVNNGNLDVGGCAIFMNQSNPLLEFVTFKYNFAPVIALQNDSNPILKNVIISENRGWGGVAGIYLYLSDPILINVTIAENYTEEEGQVIIYSQSSNPIFINCIIWNDNPQENGENYIGLISEGTGLPIVSFSNIQGSWTGEGNIDANPLFTDPDNGDYRLSWDNYPNEDVTMSPCIDAGTADLDGDGNEDITDYFGQAPDMGAFEWYPEEPDYQPGDVTQDGSVNVQDIILLITFILMNDTPDSNEFALADLNTDSQLNVLDVVILVDMILGE